MENIKSTHEFPDWTELKMLFSGKLSLKEEKHIIMRIQKYQARDILFSIIILKVRMVQ
jgi:hypothetical protein